MEVEVHEEPRAVELIQELINYGDKESVLDGDCVEGMVVDTEPPRTIFLADQEHRGRESARAWLYHA